MFLYCLCTYLKLQQYKYIFFLIFLYLYFWQNLKVHENRRQLFSSTASNDAANPFIRQRPLVARPSSSTSTAAPPAWASSSASSSQLFPR